MSNRVKLDINVPAGMFDFLTEVESDVTSDPIAAWREDATCSYKGMSADVSYQHALNLREESRERTTKFNKRFDVVAGNNSTPADSKRLEKAAKIPAKVETVNGWRMEYGEDGELIRAYEVSE